MNPSDKIIFYKFFSRTLAQGLSAREALHLFSRESPLKYWHILYKVEKNLSAGCSLSKSLAKVGRNFSLYETVLIASSQSKKELSKTFSRLAQIVYQKQIFKKRISNLIIYPLMLFAGALILLSLLIFFILPRFAMVLNNFSGQLNYSFILKFSLNLNQALLNFFSTPEYLILMIILLAIFVWKFFKSQRLRLILEFTLLNFPILGALLKKQEVSQLSFLWSEMLKSKVKKKKIFKILTASTKWTIYQKIIIKMSKVKKISKLWTKEERVACKNSSLFSFSLIHLALPPLFRKFIELGEKTASLEDELAEITEIYQEEIKSDLKYALNFLEPFLILGTAFLVGLIAYIIYSSYWEMQGAILKGMQSSF